MKKNSTFHCSNMAGILFTHSYFMRFDPKQWKQQQPYPPLGTIYAAALLRNNGYNVSLFDAMFAFGPEDIVPAIKTQKPDIVVIYDDGFNYLTKMCLTNMRLAAFKMIALAKQAGCKVIISSSDSADHAPQYLQNGADYVIKGEAEITLLNLVNKISGQETDMENIPGLVFLKNGQLITTAKREILRDLDTLPMPAWDLVNIKPYKNAWLSKWGYFSINIATTRGCPFKCNWCAKPIYGNRYNSRSPENVAKEILYLKQQYSIDHIWFCDDIFGLKPGWVQHFANLAEQHGIKIKFKIQCRADLLVEEDYVAALARAGCEFVWMGAESGSQKILDAMDKGITVEQIYAATALLKKHGVKPAFFLQFGYPGENIDDINKTMQMLLELMPADIGVSVSYPLPGTKFYERVKEELKEKANWTDSDELALMFRNTYPPQFYKSLHRFVHKIYRNKESVENLKQILSNPFEAGKKDFIKAFSMLYYTPAAAVYRVKMKRYDRAL